MKSLFIIFIGIAVSWHFTDIASESILYRVLAPVGVAVFLISLLVWLVMFFHNRGISQTTGLNGDSGGFGDGGGDG